MLEECLNCTTFFLNLTRWSMSICTGDGIVSSVRYRIFSHWTNMSENDTQSWFSMTIIYIPNIICFLIILIWRCNKCGILCCLMLQLNWQVRENTYTTVNNLNMEYTSLWIIGQKNNLRFILNDFQSHIMQ